MWREGENFTTAYLLPFLSLARAPPKSVFQWKTWSCKYIYISAPKQIRPGKCSQFLKLLGNQTTLHNALMKAPACIKIMKWMIKLVGKNQLIAEMSIHRRMDKQRVGWPGCCDGVLCSNEKEWGTTDPGWAGGARCGRIHTQDSMYVTFKHGQN